MKLSAVFGAIVALVVALTAVSWLSSGSPALSTASKIDGRSPASQPPSTAPAAAKTEEKEKDWHDENPFQTAEAGSHPKAEVSEPDFAFGSMTLGDTGTHIFIIRNTGEAPLKVAKGPTTCKCTIPMVSGGDVPPGGEVEVELKWKPVARDINFRQQATIWTNDPETPKLQLSVHGIVAPASYLMPEGGVNVGEIEQGQTRTITGMALSMTRDDLEVTKVETSTDKITTEVSLADENILTEQSAKKGFAIKMTIAPSDDVGQFRETVTVHTNQESTPSMTWDITGTRPGPVKIVGQGWYAQRQAVTMGRFQASEGSTHKLSMFISKFDQPLEIKEIVTDSPITVRIEHDPKFKLESKDRYWLYIEFPKGGVPGGHSLEEPVPVTLMTNHPKIPSFTFNVQYEAF